MRAYALEAGLAVHVRDLAERIGVAGNGAGQRGGDVTEATNHNRIPAVGEIELAAVQHRVGAVNIVAFAAAQDSPAESGSICTISISSLKSGGGSDVMPLS